MPNNTGPDLSMGRPQPVHQKMMANASIRGARITAANNKKGHARNRGSQMRNSRDSPSSSTRKIYGGQIMG